MTEQHPITPPPELMEQWRDRWIDDAAEDNTQDLGIRPSFMVYIATQAARWGADQELEACSEWLLNSSPWTVDPNERPEWVQTLKRCRRPKPPSLAKQGCDALDTYIYGNPNHKDKERTYNTIRAALERLQELESAAGAEEQWLS